MAGLAPASRKLLKFENEEKDNANAKNSHSEFAGAVGKDVVSRTWRKVKSDWETWNVRSLKDDKIVRLILDGTVVRVRALGVREDGQKVLLAVNNMGGESAEAWRALLDDFLKRGMRTPDLVMVDGGKGRVSPRC